MFSTIIALDARSFWLRAPPLNVVGAKPILLWLVKFWLETNNGGKILRIDQIGLAGSSK